MINEQSLDQKDFCDPVSFKKNPDMAQLAALEAKRQEPKLPPAKDGDLLTEKDGAKVCICVYMYICTYMHMYLSYNYGDAYG